ncbi:hypothetical protein LOB72_05865 [Lactobacillus delbrueckii subsp. lactis]|uniref:hypothetical protein n=1 Tax=Lactobacillus delbrueckii TaxID=1584 RepID=UPI001E34E062|nr:hypothetical protein [Lactobacillus delbrueckii]MCD5448276.1 hypothetical protein [Lactobacillus delbrueckii subsp. lactis]
MRETEIIGQFFARDEAALTSVQSEYGAYCSTIARNILRDKEGVEECLNDTWLKAWNRSGRRASWPIWGASRATEP